MLRSYKKIKVSDKNITQVQENVEQVLVPVLACPIIDGVLIKDICLSPATSNEVMHRLGRKPLGWFIVRKRADSRIWDLQDTNPEPSRTLSITCSHAVTIDIWVF